jgi:hypothetical protein
MKKWLVILAILLVLASIGRFHNDSLGCGATFMIGDYGIGMSIDWYHFHIYIVRWAPC